MFTGVGEELGRGERLERDAGGARLRSGAAGGAERAPGDSVAVSGACLTVVDPEAAAFEADVVNQTLSLTTLGDLAPGDRVNLEPALRTGEPLGGHIVQGHVDAVGELVAVEQDGVARRIRVRLPDRLERYAVEHGSITLAGVSLTVAGLAGDEVEVSLIPETLERTTLGGLAAGDRINVELDVIARYVERLLRCDEPSS
jgi:riboflavin synthase